MRYLLGVSLIFAVGEVVVCGTSVDDDDDDDDDGLGVCL